MMKTLLIGAAALAIALPATAQYQPAPQTVRAMPSAMPMAPRAQRVQTRNEVVAKLRDRFARLDTDRDGFITKAETDAQRGQRKLGQRGRNGNRDGNRLALRDGARGNPGAMFDRLDANRDGQISRDEFSRARDQRQQHRMAANGARGAPGARAMRLHRMGGMGGGHMLRMADLDRDGRVSLQEATTSALQHFDQADTNRDGRITPDERGAMRQRMIDQRGRKAG
jgi:Ca2+-binding EF-hand superfamily protein